MGLKKHDSFINFDENLIYFFQNRDAAALSLFSPSFPFCCSSRPRMSTSLKDSIDIVHNIVHNMTVSTFVTLIVSLQFFSSLHYSTKTMALVLQNNTTYT